jgi:hypothetical protein
MDQTRLFRAWQQDPVQFVWDNFGGGIEKIDPWQEEYLRSLAEHNRIAGTASKGPGKTCCLAWASWWFMTCFPKPNIAAVSISSENLRDGLWKEMAKWSAHSDLIKNQFTITTTRIVQKDNPFDWWMSARAFSKTADATAQADTLAGLHSDYMMFIIDEAGSVPDGVGAAAEAAISTEGGKKLYLIMGNPTTRGGPLWRANTSETHLWKNIRINGDPDSPVRSSRVSVKWAREQIEKYGRDSAFVKVNVFGEFPEVSLNALMGDSEVVAAFRRRADQDVIDRSQKRIGVDVARFGDDRTVIMRRQGPMAYAPMEYRNLRTNEIGDLIIKEAADWECRNIFVDDTGGYGSGVVDYLLQHGLAPTPVNFASKPIDAQYLNRRAEMWFEMSKWVKGHGVLPENSEMCRELSAPMYDFSNGKFKLESKEDIKSRLGYSPDIADALALTFAIPELPAKKYELPGIKQEKVKIDWDPFI